MATPDETVASASVAPYGVSAEEALAFIRTNARCGLSHDEATARQLQYGPNELKRSAPPPWWKKFLEQFKPLVIWILIGAAIVAGALGEWGDTLAIVAIVLLNGVLGFLQEEKAQRALEALQNLSAPSAKVIRDGQLQSLPARDLVPGDIVQLEAGDYVPADVRLIEGFALAIQEASLTGESEPVQKDPAAVLDVTTPLADRRNMSYLGTSVTAGKATAVVTATGMSTELGRIAGMLGRFQPEPTPLQRRLEELGRILIVVCLALVTIIFALQMLRGGKLVEVFLLSISLAVAAVPEGLPAVVTIALALGLQRMVRRQALVRKLPSVETLGSVTVICSDKTGTLTRNEMTVRRIIVGDRDYSVTGVGYLPQGEFIPLPGLHDLQVSLLDKQELDWALTIAARCNNAEVKLGNDTGDSSSVVGDPTEGALLVAALKAGIEKSPEGVQLLEEFPFDSQRKMMSVVYRIGDQIMTFSKGAPEVILSKCSHERRAGQVETLTDERRQEWTNRSAELASQALRVLVLAYRECSEPRETEYHEQNLILAGLVGMLDPPREEVKLAIDDCRRAGIRPVMITGDHPATALAVARELQLTTESKGVLTGRDMDVLSEGQLAEQVRQTSIYARVSAEHKLRVVQAWKSHGEIVAMTGDGVNDAPALQAADIGIAMGITGADVTKEASDIVLMDDNFASIVHAVEEGRGIFDNIQKFIHYLLACNAGEILFMFWGALVNWPVPLMAIQILWINLVTDGLPALALAMEPPESDIMRRPPRPPREPVITWRRGMLMLFHGMLIAAATAVGFHLTYAGDPTRLNEARAAAFCILAYSQLFYSFGCRSQRRTLPQLGLFTNPFLFGSIFASALLQLGIVTLPWARDFFHIANVQTLPWATVLGLSLAPVTIIELIKLLQAALVRTSRKSTHAN